MNTQSKNEIIVAGAGIAGLALACFLSQAGRSVIVLEKRGKPTTEGAGIQLTPNAGHVLLALGLSLEQLGDAHHAQSLSVHAGKSSRKLVEMPFGQAFTKRFKLPYLVLHRQDLIDLLTNLTVSNGTEIVYDCSVEDVVENNESQVVLQTSKGIYSSDAVVAADGIWSSIRKKITDTVASPSGRVAHRCLIENAGLDQQKAFHDLSVWLGPNAHFVKYPVSRDKQLNLVAITKGSDFEEFWSSPVPTEAVLSHYEGWCKEVRTLIAQSEHWVKWPLSTIHPNHRWTKERITLIGDAAHGMVPFLAQGGATALEDAAVLADELGNNQKPEDAFQIYEQKRKDRIIRIWQEAWSNGERYHWPSPMAEARDLVMPLIGGQRLLNRYDWIYDWCPPQLLKGTKS